MSKAISLGYTRPSSASIEITRLSFIIDGEEFNAASSTPPTWDYESNISILAELDVDLEQLTRECGYVHFAADEDLPEFAVLTSWSCNKTRQRGASPRQKLINGHNTINFEFEDKLLGGEVETRLHIDLLKPGIPFEGAVVATRPGSRLWASSPVRVRLEGNSAQMPMVPIDFVETQVEPRKSMWKIEVSRELFRPVQAGIRVYINTAHPLALRMLEKETGKERTLWDAYLKADVIAQLLLNADGLADLDDFEDNPLFPGSLAESIVNLAQTFFPRTPFEDIPKDPSLVLATAQQFAFKGMK